MVRACDVIGLTIVEVVEGSVAAGGVVRGGHDGALGVMLLALAMLVLLLLPLPTGALS